MTDKQIAQAAIDYSKGKNDAVIKRGAFYKGAKWALAQSQWIPVTEAAEKLRMILDVIQGTIDIQNGATESQLKLLWNDISDVVTELDQITLPEPPKTEKL